MFLLQARFCLYKQNFLFQMELVQVLTAVGHSRSTAALCLPRLSLSQLIHKVGSGKPQTSEGHKKKGVSYWLFNLVEELKLGEAPKQLEPGELGQAELAEDLSCWYPGHQHLGVFMMKTSPETII